MDTIAIVVAEEDPYEVVALYRLPHVVTNIVNRLVKAEVNV